jgi:DNA repair exonuclease SbcCD ATPase subunit
MSSENYINHYVELLTATMQDAVLRNISLQANSRVTEEAVNNISKENEELKNLLNSKDDSSSGQIKTLEQEIKNLQDQLNRLRSLEGEYNNVKSQAQHVETFRNELQKARQEIEDLKKQIDYLQLTPAKRKKVDDAKPKVGSTSTILTVASENTQFEDGGTF